MSNAFVFHPKKTGQPVTLYRKLANTTAAVVNSVKQLFYQCGSVRENELTTVIYDSIMFVLRSTEGRLILGSVFFLPFILGSIT